MEPPPKSLYAILGVGRACTSDEIIAAYRKLALAFHPDRPGGSHARFLEIQQAYEVLSTADSRERYDQLLQELRKRKSYKRPAELAAPQQPVYYLLPDGLFYAFESAPNKLKCRIHYGDGILFQDRHGSFLGLAADDYFYWVVDGQEFATRLCEAGSTFALSSIRVLYRSNLAMNRRPASRPFAAAAAAAAGPPPATATAPNTTPVDAEPSAEVGQQSSACRRNGTMKNGSSARGLSEAQRLKEQLRQKGRLRAISTQIDATIKAEGDTREQMEVVLWNDFCSFQTTLTAVWTCIMQGVPLPEELSAWVGYGAVTQPSPSPPCLDAVWLDKLDTSCNSDGAMMMAKDEDAMSSSSTSASPSTLHASPPPLLDATNRMTAIKAIQHAEAIPAKAEVATAEMETELHGSEAAALRSSTSSPHRRSSSSFAVNLSDAPSPLVVSSIQVSMKRQPSISGGALPLSNLVSPPLPDSDPAAGSFSQGRKTPRAASERRKTADRSTSAIPSIQMSTLETKLVQQKFIDASPAPGGQLSATAAVTKDNLHLSFCKSDSPDAEATQQLPRHSSENRSEVNQEEVPEVEFFSVIQSKSAELEDLHESSAALRPTLSGSPAPVTLQGIHFFSSGSVSSTNGGSGGMAGNFPTPFCSPAAPLVVDGRQESPPVQGAKGEAAAVAPTKLHANAEADAARASSPSLRRGGSPLRSARRQSSVVATPAVAAAVPGGGDAAPLSETAVTLDISAGAVSARADESDAAHASPSPLRETLVESPLRVGGAASRNATVSSASPFSRDILPGNDGGLSGGLSNDATKKPSSRPRWTPRYMQPTVAHSRRASGVGGSQTAGSDSAGSPRSVTANRYASLTAHEMFEQELEFMVNFSKSKKAI